MLVFQIGYRQGKGLGELQQMLHFGGLALLQKDILSFTIQSLLLLTIEKKSFEDITGKGEKRFSLSNNVFYPSNGKSYHLILNPFPNMPWFLCVCSTSLLKTLWKKEKLLVTSNFSFSHSVFYPLEEPFSIFVKFEIVKCKLLSLEESKIYRLGKG